MICIIIPAYNEEKVIGACLDSLTKQKTSRQFRVILVNNNSTDKTVEIAKQYQGKLDLMIVLQKQKGRGPARHLGFEMADTDIIVSSDADAVLPENWLERLTSKLETSQSTAVTGTCKIVDCGNFRNAVFNYMQPLTMRFYRMLFGHYWLSGFSFAIKRDSYKKAGGFNQQLNGLEDIDLSFRVAKVGKITFIDDLPVIFSGRRFKQGLLHGTLQYIIQFIAYYVFKKSDFVFSDAR